MYTTVVVPDHVIDACLQHNCSSTSSVPLCCIHENGMITAKWGREKGGGRKGGAERHG